MPEKITSKNLSYSSSLPPFLQRLHAQAGGAIGPDPLLAGQRRSAKKRSSSEEAEDAPLVVDAYGNNVDVQVEKDGTVKEGESKDSESIGEIVASKADEKVKKQDAENKSSIGTRKRKVGKLIGQDASDAGHTDEAAEKKVSPQEDTPVVKRMKKKAVKIKLSFDEDEG